MKKHPWIWILLGSIYLIGKFIEIQLIGPDWLRWHLADFGFIFYAAFWLRPWWYGSQKASLVMALVIAVGFELIQFKQGGGDILDIATFVVAFLIGWRLIDRSPSGQ